jgi:hypothetical protein
MARVGCRRRLSQRRGWGVHLPEEPGFDQPAQHLQRGKLVELGLLQHLSERAHGLEILERCQLRRAQARQRSLGARVQPEAAPFVADLVAQALRLVLAPRRFEQQHRHGQVDAAPPRLSA